MAPPFPRLTVFARVTATLAAAGLLVVACASGPSLADPEASPTTPPDTVPSTTVPSTTLPSTTPTPPADTGTDPPPARGPVPVGRIVTGADGRITVHDPDGHTPIDTAATARQPTWSRDGSRLVVSGFEGGTAVVEVYDADGTPRGRTVAARPYFFFSWSHDGTRIAALGPGELGTTLDLLDGGGTIVAENVATADTVFVGWDPESPTLAVHEGEDLVRVEADGSAVRLGTVGRGFLAPKWIPGSRDLLLVVDLEGTPTLVRRGLRAGDTTATLGSAPEPLGIAVRPDGEVAALTRRGTAEDGGGRSPVGTHLVQEETGLVELIDLATNERMTVFEGRALWTEWDPTGDHLLVGEIPDGGRDGTWWIVDGTTSVTADDPPPVADLATPLIDFVAPSSFLDDYLAFGDQYVEQPRLWAPTGEAFVTPTITSNGGVVAIVPVDGSPVVAVGPGAVGFWSPNG